jgi:CP family cyanate transporter-like MFS transporter
MGSFPLALSLLALRTRTAGAVAGLSAFAQSTGYLIAGGGPIAFGLLHQVSGGWAVPFVLLFASAVAQAVTGWYAGANRTIEDEFERESEVSRSGETGVGHARHAAPGHQGIRMSHLSRGVRDRIVAGARRRDDRAWRDRGADAAATRPNQAKPAKPSGRAGDRPRSVSR